MIPFQRHYARYFSAPFLGHKSALIVLFITALFAHPVLSKNAADICESIAAQVSKETGVPQSVLQAISLNETGRKNEGRFRPWPWTVNMEGKGVWFDSYPEALAFAKKEFARGARSFDLGCFQINYKWHHQAFSSIEEMFDPAANARYAAKFLSELYAEKGDWTEAAGAYHSRTPKYANRYSARFAKFRAQFEQSPIAPQLAGNIPTIIAKPERAARVNTFPFLVAGSTSAGFGSLVPINEPGGTRLISIE
ncbi:MAG: lytic transglycosylase domain-containing protein [Paracoccaceae bacterium]